MSKLSNGQCFLSSLKRVVQCSLIFGIAFLVNIDSVNAQEVVRDLTFKLIGLDTASRDANSKKVIDAFWKEMKFLDKYEREQVKFKGDLNFGFSGDEADNQDLYKLNGGIKVTRGIYPGELEFSSNLGIVLNNNRFNEDVSNVFIAYDYHPKILDSLAVENFAFVSRFTDAFLGVEQRYEAGVGTIFSFWSKKLTKKGEKEKKAVNDFIVNPASFNSSSGIWGICKNHCLLYQNKSLKEKEIKELKRVQDETRLSIRKLFSKVRVGLLMGILVETEKVSFSDSLETNNGKIYREVDFDATQKLRWELRPTFDLKPKDSWSLKIRPFFKLPMPWAWEENIVGEDTGGRFDYRIDLNTTLAIKLMEQDTPNKSVGVELSYDLYYDNAPQRRIIDGFFDPENNPLVFQAGKLHQVYRMSVKVSF